MTVQELIAYLLTLSWDYHRADIVIELGDEISAKVHCIESQRENAIYIRGELDE